jgi:hypothetical protein
MTNSSFLKKLLFALSVVFFVSCEKDFNTLGSDIVGDDIHSDMTPYYVDVTAYDRPTGAVQSNNLTLNQLGVIDNPVFGKTVSHFVTQVQIPSGSEKPTLYSPVIDSVYMYIPYFSTATDAIADPVDTGTQTIYELDSIYGKKDATLTLEVYRNGYYLRDNDPAATDKLQRYYSDDFGMVESLKLGAPLAVNPTFTFETTEKKRKANTKGTLADGTQPQDPTYFKVVERLAPGILMDLDKNAMQAALFNTENRGNLLNNNVFSEYFRGLYFKVTQNGTDAVAAIPKFSEGKIFVKYHDNAIGVDALPTDEIVDKTMTLTLTGNSINFYQNTFNGDFNSAITASDAVNGDSRLYVKGGAGSMAIIDINQAGLDAITGKKTGEKVLINEANLVFYVDQAKMASAVEPMRVYLYDLKNNKPLYDYSVDGTTTPTNVKFNKYVHGGLLELDKPEDEGGKGLRYKIRLTHHINNIVNGDSLNVKLGLVVTENINVVTNVKLKTPFTEGDTAVNFLPLSSVQHPFGTVLYGSNVPEEEKDKKVKLEIFYTKPKD